MGLSVGGLMEGRVQKEQDWGGLDLVWLVGKVLATLSSVACHT